MVLHSGTTTVITAALLKIPVNSRLFKEATIGSTTLKQMPTMKKNNYMHNKKISLLLKILVIIITIIFIVYVTSISVWDILKDKKVKTITNSRDFEVETIFSNLNDCIITEEYSTFYNDDLICYECIIDSIYQFSITKVGYLANKDNLGIYKTSNSFIKSKHRRRMCSTVSPINYSPSFDSGVIPLNRIDSLVIFVDGHIDNTVVKKNNLVAYSLNIGSLVFSFNDHNNMDLYYIDVHSPNSNSFLFFYLDKDRLLYIGLCNLPLSMW